MIQQLRFDPNISRGLGFRTQVLGEFWSQVFRPFLCLESGSWRRALSSAHSCDSPEPLAGRQECEPSVNDSTAESWFLSCSSGPRHWTGDRRDLLLVSVGLYDVQQGNSPLEKM